MTRRFELIAGSSAKFWEVTLDDLVLTTRYGRVGASGQQTTKVFTSNDQALRELERLVKEKVGKGYVELGGATTTPETVYLEHPQTRQFLELHEDNNHLRVRRGSLENPCLTYHAPFVTPGKARTQLERLLGEWQTNGFVVTQPLEPILDGSVAHSLYTDEIEDHPVYSQFFDLGWASDLRGEEGQRLFHFREGLRAQGHFDLEEIADMNLESGVIIEGDVVVSGVFSQLSYTYPGSTLITGSVRAHGLGHKDSFLRILGDVHVDNIVYGEYNDGQLEIEGTAYGNAWISADHSMSAGAYEIEVVGEDYARLTPKVLDLDGNLDWDALREYLFANKNPLRKGTVSKVSTLEPMTESLPPSALALEVRALAAVEDVEGLTALLEQWTARDDEWRGFVEGRLIAPSSTAAQRERLRALLEPWSAPLEGSIGEAHAAHPAIAKLLEIIAAGDAVTALEAVEHLPDPALIASHSFVLLSAVSDAMKTKGRRWLEVMARLLELGADPRLGFMGCTVMDALREGSDPYALEILELIYKSHPELMPDESAWTPPASGQVTELFEAHPRVAQVLYLMTDPTDPDDAMNWTYVHDALESPFAAGVIEAHGWALLTTALQRMYADSSRYLDVIERLLDLGADPRVSFEGMPLGILKHADHLDLDAALELFYQRFPELRPAPTPPEEVVHGIEILDKLIQLEDSGADWSAAEISAAWLEPIYQLQVTAQAVERIPAALGKLRNLRSLGLVMLEPAGRKLPDSLSELVNLEGLGLATSGFKSVPDLSKLSHLRELSLRGNKLLQLPALPIHLERLNYDENPLLQAPDLSALTKLQFLSLDKVKLMPMGLQKLRDLQEFSAAGCKLEVFPAGLLNLAKLQKIVLADNKLSTLPDLSGLSALRVLDLSNNKLQRLPTGLLALPNLEWLLLEGNRALEKLLERDAAQRAIYEELRSRGVRFVTEDSAKTAPPRMDADTHKALREIKLLNKKANDRQTSDLTAAFELFERVVATSSPHLLTFPEDFAHDHLYALQGRLWCVNELAQDDTALIEQAIRLAEEILEFTSDSTNFYYSAEGALIRSSQTLAHNALAWYGLQTGVNLGKALEHISAASEGLDCASQAAAFETVFENKVKILLALNRDDDAHVIIFQMRRAYPDLEVFGRLAQTPAFERWDAEN